MVHAANLKILAVEDHPDVARLMGELLTNLGHRPTLALNLEEANEALRGDGFDLVISDYNLPDGTGADVVRLSDAYHKIPAILVSAYAHLIKHYREMGFGGFMLKPVDFEALQTTIEEVTA